VASENALRVVSRAGFEPATRTLKVHSAEKIKHFLRNKLCHPGFGVAGNLMSIVFGHYQPRRILGLVS
jgi:hypothetical protein